MTDFADHSEPASAPAGAVRTGDARSRVVARGREIAERDVREVDRYLSAREVFERFGPDFDLEGCLGIPLLGSRPWYPEFQFGSDGRPIPGFAELMEIMSETNPVAILNFLVGPDPKLDGRRPMDAMREGRGDLVLESALRIGHQGA